MDALILAAGFGSRLKEYTKNTPKCLLKIKNKPIISYWIDCLLENNINQIFINTHYLSDQVTQYINSSYNSKKIKLIHEKKLLGTAGTLLQLINKIKGDIIVAHADNYFEDDIIEKLINYYNSSKNINFLMLIFKYTGASINYGVVDFNEKNILTNMYEKNIITSKLEYANAATYVISKKTLNEIKSYHAKAYEITKDIIPYFINRIHVLKTNKIFIDIGTKENFHIANRI